MASACVNNITVSPEKFPPATYSSYSWLSPRMSFSREEEASKQQGSKPSSVSCDHPAAAEDPPEISDPVDFEFRLDDPVAMLPADELFSDGKLMPLRVAAGFKPAVVVNVNGFAEIRSPDTVKSCRTMEMEISGTDPYLFSPKAPRCSSRWKELLGLKKLYQNANAKAEAHKNATSFLSSSSSSSSSSVNPNPKSLKHFLHRSSKSCSCNSSSSSSLDQSLNLPLLKDSDCESVSISSSRLSLSSSSSSHEHEDLPRLSLDSEKPNPLQSPNPNPFILNRNPNPPRMRMVKPRCESNTNNSNNNNNNNPSNRVGRSPMRKGNTTTAAGGESSGVTSRGVSVDSPRMNSSGKIVFQSLERSSSSPSSFNGAPRYKHRGMERSYSANVRVTPVLNVPVCSLRGTSKSVFGQLFSSSPQKKDSSSSSSSTNRGQIHQHHNSSSSSRHRTSDRTTTQQ